MNSGLIIETDERLTSIRSQLRDLKSLLRCERVLWMESRRTRSQAASERDDFLSRNESHPGFKRAVSAKRILRNLNPAAATQSFEETQAGSPGVFGWPDLLKRDLLYFIAATDGSDDTMGHSRSVAAYAVLLAKAAGITSPDRLIDLERGALLHDIGKIVIPDSILRKPGALTPLEREVVKEHPLLGYEIVREFDFLKGAAQVVLYHHERFDGRGYPFRLSGRQIPPEARIFSIVDTIDAITSNRTYRRGASFGGAFDEVEAAAGSQFDPELVRVMLSIPSERWLWIKRSLISRLRPAIAH